MTKPDDDRITELRALADVTPPVSLVPAVMKRLSRPRRRGLWAWALRPRRLELRLSPVAMAALAAAAIFIGVFARSRPSERGIALNTATQEQLVTVRFVLMAKGAKQVAVAGNFNGWDTNAVPLSDTNGDGVFAATVQLPRGAHEYMFVVDGAWVTDPAAAERRADGFGRDNAVLRL